MGLFEIPVKRVEDPRNRRAGPIGTVVKRQETSFTTFVREDDGGEWLHGPEVPAHFQLETRAFRRATVDAGAESGGRIVNFFRYELTVTPHEGRKRGVAPGDTLVIADLPLGQRRFQTARIQRYAERLEPLVFEDLTEPPMPPSLAARAGLDDMQAIDLLHRLPVNLFASEHVYSAAIAGTQAGAFIGYDDFETDPVWTEDIEPAAHQAAKRLPPIAARTRKDGSYAFGVVKNLRAVRDAIWSGRRFRKVWDATGAGTYRLPSRNGGRLVPPEVASRLADHMEIAIIQALAGAGAKWKSWEGRPVAHRALDLLHEHLAYAIDRWDGRSIPPDAIDPWDGQSPPQDPFDGDPSDDGED